MDIEILRFPLGPYVAPNAIDENLVVQWTDDIRQLPAQLRKAVEILPDNALETKYRPDGWTRRQVVNHIADSHLNAYIRVKLALTAQTPTIAPYDENLWVETPEVAAVDISYTLGLIEGLHHRWSILLQNIPFADFKRVYFHPEHGRTFNLEYVAGMYAWHGKHHVAQISSGNYF